MKAIAYNIKPDEKECLVLANHKKHDITIIANSLSFDTISFAEGKETLLVFNNDIVDEQIVKRLKELGVKYIATSSFETNHLDLKSAAKAGLKIANVPLKDGQNSLDRMNRVIKNLDNWAAGKCVGSACCCQNNCGVVKSLNQE